MVPARRCSLYAYPSPSSWKRSLAVVGVSTVAPSHRFPLSLSSCVPREASFALIRLWILEICARIMARNPACTVYIGNLDERVTDRVLYEILIQVGRVVDLHVPLNKETNRHRGYAFAEYESEEIANYAVRLFSGLVRLYNKTLKFAMSGQDKPSPTTATPVTPQAVPLPSLRPHSVPVTDTKVTYESTPSTSCRMSAHTHSNYTEAPRLGYVNNGLNAGNYDYSRSVFSSTMNFLSSQDSRFGVGHRY